VPPRPSIFQIPPDVRGKPIPPPLAMPPPPPRRPTPMTRQVNVPDAAELDRLTRVREALNADRHEVQLRTIVRLPSRRVSHYEAISRLRDAGGDVLPNADHLSAAERGGLMPDIDRLVFTAISGMARKLAAGNKTAGVIFNLAPATLIDGKLVADLFRLADEDPAIAEHLVLQMPQLSWIALSPSESDKVASLVEKGYRVSLDRLGHMRLDGRELARRGVRYVKLQATLLLDPKAAAASPIHPADLAGLLERNGVTLIVDDVDQEALVPELLDVGVKFAQGPVFGEARPIRPDSSPEPTRKGSGGRSGQGD
jgi:cyclic-di-GMP phosphodiesterase TipF (flagellum assembly factor)